MNIWIVNHYADSPDRQSTRSYDLAKKLVERGHQVTIFAAGYNHYSFREERILPGKRLLEEHWDGVRFIWLKTFPYHRNDWRRVLNMISFSWGAFWVGFRLTDRPDVISGVSVHPLAALTGWCLSRVKRSRFFVEVTDLWPEVLIQFGMLSRRNPVATILRALETFLYRKAERIIMVWPCTREYVKGLGVAPEKVVWLPHLVDPSRYTTLAPYDGLLKQTFTVMYLGSFVSFMDMENILRCAKVLQDRKNNTVRFVLVGGGTNKHALEQQAGQLQLSNVVFRDLVPKHDIANVLGGADTFVVSLKDVPLLRYGVSLNKVCDYLASGRPTVFAGSPGYDPIKEANAGISVGANDPAALADAVETMMALPPEQRLRMGLNGLDYLDRVHNIDILSTRLEDIFVGCGQDGSLYNNARMPPDAVGPAAR